MDLTIYAAAQARADRARAAEWERIGEEAKADRREWISQESTLLGRRRHHAIVRRRIAAGDTTHAAISGRRHLLSQAAHDEELAALSKRKPAAPEVNTTAARLERRLGLVAGAGR